MNIDTQIESLLDILEFLLNKLNVANIADLKEILEDSINEILTIKNNLSDCKFKEIEKERENEDTINDDGDNSSDFNLKEEDFGIDEKENENTDDYETKLIKEEQEASPEEKHVVLNHHLQTVESFVKSGIKPAKKSIVLNHHLQTVESSVKSGVKSAKKSICRHYPLSDSRGNSRGICDICSFEYKGDREEHILDNHLVNGKYSCPKCEFKSDDEYSLIGHSRAHKIPPLYVCPTGACSQSFKKVVGENGFLKHLEDEHNYRTEDLLCPICHLKRSANSSLVHHIQTIHNQNLDLQCKKCLKTLSTPQTYVKHMKWYHGNVKILKCQECGYTTKFEKFMKAHNLKEHSHAAVEKVFQTNCEFCGMRLPYKERQKHVEEHHVADGKYHCPTCNYVSEDESGLQEHCKNEHSDKTVLFFCPECNDESFHRAEELIDHMIKEHNFKLEEMKCPICNKKRTNNRIAAHIRSVHSSFDNQCQKCLSCHN